MGTFIDIEKIHEDAEKIIYSVWHTSLDKKFFMILRPQFKERICFAKELKNGKEICFDFNSDQLLEAFDIPSHLLAKAFYKGKQALTHQEFPQYISYQSKS